jgi:hypothetical protein
MVDGVGNTSWTVYAEDNNQPGTGTDRFWLSVAGRPAFSMSAPATSNAQLLTGGNVGVPRR